MNAQAAAQARMRLARAEKAYTEMESAKTLNDTEEAWSDFLIAVSAIYSKLEQGSKGNPKSHAWFGQKKHERKTDSLLRYLHAARNSNEHGIERIVEATGENRHPFENRQLLVNERFPAKAQKLNKITRQPDPEEPIFDVVVAGPTLRPVRASDSRFNDYCDPPTHHLGKQIKFADFADSLAITALPYLRNLVSEAEALVLAPPSP